MSKSRVVAAFAVMLWGPARTRAEEGPCDGRIDRGNVVRCALAVSPRARAERFGVEATAGREQAARTLLPQNPVLALQGARRKSGEQEATNWYGTLSQEVEIAGQRGARRRVAAAERGAQEQIASGAEREVAAQAWRAYFEALAARDASRLASRMVGIFEHAGLATQAAAQRGLASGVEADLADATLVALRRAQIEAARRESAALAGLTVLVGAAPGSTAVSVEGELRPLVGVDGLLPERAAQLALKRPEIAQASAARLAAERRIELLRRARAPNLTVSATAQRDGFHERVLGGGVSIPLSLPHPLGRTLAGEIAESRALALRAASELQQVERQVQLDAVIAARALDAARTEDALFTEERVRRAEQSLSSIAEGIRSGNLVIANVLVAQQALIELLRGQVDARLALCLGSVELARAAGLSLEEGTP